MSNFTKGEWFANREGQSTVYVECRIGGGWLQEVAACGPTANGSEEQEANAKLIAAAPDLLEALQKIQFRLECFIEDDRDMRVASLEVVKSICDKAITKAIAQ